MVKSIKNLIASASSLLWYGLPALALAQPQFQNGSLGLQEFGTHTNLGTQVDLIPAVARIINILLGFLGVLAVVLVLWGGFKWMTAAGEESKIEEAKKLMGGGVVGLIIILAAYAITAFVVSQLTAATNFRGT